MKRLVVATAAFALCACPDGHTIPPGAGRDAGPAKDAAQIVPAGDMRASGSWTYVAESNEEVKAPDRSGVKIAAFAEANGDVVKIMGSGKSDGTMEVKGVPAGEVALQVGGEYYFTTSRDLDLSLELLGRSDGVATSEETNLDFEVANLAAWQPGDELEVFSIGAGFFFYSAQAIGTRPPEADDRVLSMTLDSNLAFPSGVLIDGAKGDRLSVAQLSQRLAGDVPYLSLVRFFSAPAFTQSSGLATHVTGRFDDVPQTSTVAIDWKRSEFEALRALTHPRAVPASQQLFVEAQPAGLEHGNFSATPDVLLVAPPPSDEDLSLGDVTFGNPYPNAWPLIAGAFHRWTVAYSLPGARKAARLHTSVLVQERAGASGVFRPGVSPVRDVKIGGRDAFVDPTGVGLTPVVAWTEPAVGAPTEYQVEIVRLFAREGEQQTDYEFVATLRTRGTRVRVPSGVLVEGERYVFSVIAYVVENQNFDVKPNVFSIAQAGATVLSEVVSP